MSAARRDRIATIVSSAARPLRIEDPTNRLVIHRLSAGVLPWAIRSGIHPNTVSLMGLGFALLAGAAYSQWRQPWFVVLGFVLMCGWHVCDGLDGQLARATGRASPIGRLVDGVCDYLAFFAVLVPIAVSFPDWQAKLSFCLAAGAAHAVQSAWYEGERAAWLRRARGDFTTPGPTETQLWIEAGHNAVGRWLGSHARPVDQVLAAEPRLRERYLGDAAPWVLRMLPLSANGRTLALPIFCLLGHPEWFWWWELVALNIIAIYLWIGLRRTEARIVEASKRVLDPVQ